MPVSAGCNDRVAEYHASGPYLFGGKAQGTIEELPVPHGAQTSCQMASGRKTADHDPGPVNTPFFTVVPYERHGTGQLHKGKGEYLRSHMVVEDEYLVSGGQELLCHGLVFPGGYNAIPSAWADVDCRAEPPRGLGHGGEEIGGQVRGVLCGPPVSAFL